MGSVGIPVKDRIFSTFQKKGNNLFRNRPIIANRLTFKPDFYKVFHKKYEKPLGIFHLNL